jgi:hypothetical protein
MWRKDSRERWIVCFQGAHQEERHQQQPGAACLFFFFQSLSGVSFEKNFKL